MARALLLAEAEEERMRKMLSLRRRQLRAESAPMLLPETAFIQSFRLSKQKFVILCDDLLPFMQTSQRTSGITRETKILCALQFYASGSYQKSVGDNFSLGLSQTTVSDSLTEVTNALNQPEILAKYIKFPSTAGEGSAAARRFNDRFGFPGTLGCIDGSHIAIIRPKDYEEAYFNRKMYHSLNVMMICDADLCIMYVDASFGGASHDSHVWNLSPINDGMQRLHENGETYWFLGDSGYAQKPWMMTPILNAAEGSPEENYTTRHVQTRNVIERCFGVLKSRFRCLLAHRTLNYTPEKAGKITNACSVLHNLAINDTSIEIDEEALQNDRQVQPVPAAAAPVPRRQCPVRQALDTRLWNARTAI